MVKILVDVAVKPLLSMFVKMANPPWLSCLAFEIDLFQLPKVIGLSGFPRFH